MIPKGLEKQFGNVLKSKLEQDAKEASMTKEEKHEALCAKLGIKKHGKGKRKKKKGGKKR